MSPFLHYLVVSLHLVTCVLLAVAVLLQTGKGAGLGATLGGGSSQTVFGSRGPATFLQYATGSCAAVFIFTSLALAR